MNTIDLNCNQVLFSIRKDGEIAYIEAKDGMIETSGFVGDNKYDNFVELIKGLQGFDIKLDNFYW